MKILVAGLINCETNVEIEQFPLLYESNRFVFDQIKTSVSGVGYNQAKALHTLGGEVQFASLIGKDAIAHMIKQQLDDDQISTKYICQQMEATPQSVILFDSTGKRMAHTDLKMIQNTEYPEKLNVSDTTFAIINNILFAKPLLDQCTKANVPIVSDLHVFSDLDDAYNYPWLKASNILFFSGEKIQDDVEGFVCKLVERFPKEIVIVGMGEKGSIMYEHQSNQFYYQPIFQIGEVKNTIGAGDALCSSFSYFYFSGKSAQEALVYASYFAAYKIQFSGGAVGFLDEEALEVAYKRAISK